jgi:hypothetical protein
MAPKFGLWLWVNKDRVFLGRLSGKFYGKYLARYLKIDVGRLKWAGRVIRMDESDCESPVYYTGRNWRQKKRQIKVEIMRRQEKSFT